MAGSSAMYSFSSQPRVVSGNRKKYREPGDVDSSMFRDLKETCITWDKRVHRGNTYGMYTQQAINEAFQNAVSPPVPEKRRKRKVPEASPFDLPLPEKERVMVDLTKHLVAKEEVIVVETVEAQTDEFLPEVPPDQYQPQKTGVDISTQVEDGELFVFDQEVEPILEVLINKTLEQSVMEVEEEYEMERMAEFKVEWFQRQEAMMKDWQAQVLQEGVRWDKKEQVVKRKREEKRRQAQTLLKIQALARARQELSRVVPNAIEDLASVAFPDEKLMAIDRLFLPQLFGQVCKEVQTKVQATRQVNDVISSVVRARFAREQPAAEGHAQRKAQLARAFKEEQETRHGKIRIHIDDGAGGTRPVGPIQISETDPIAVVQERVLTWLQENMPDVAEAWRWGVVLLLDGVPVQASVELFAAKKGQISMSPVPEPPPPESENGENADAADAEGGASEA